MADKSDLAWQLEVSGKLEMLIQRTSDLTVEVKEVKDQVKTQNGNVASLWKEAARTKAALSDHQEKCPLTEIVWALKQEIDRGEQPVAKASILLVEGLEERVVGLERAQISQSSKDSSQKSTVAWVWENFGRPVLGAAATAILLLVLYHSSAFTTSQPSSTSTSTATQTTTHTGK